MGENSSKKSKITAASRPPKRGNKTFTQAVGEQMDNSKREGKESKSQKTKTVKSNTSMDESDNIEIMDEEKNSLWKSSAATGTNSDNNTDNGKKRKSTESPTYNSVIKKKKRVDFKPMDVGTLTSEVFLEKQLKENQNRHLLGRQKVKKQKLVVEKANSIRKLLDMGYSWEETREAMNQTWDISSAVDYLIDKQRNERAMQHAGKSAGLKAFLNYSHWLSEKSSKISKHKISPLMKSPSLTGKLPVTGKPTAALGKPTATLEKPTAAELEISTATLEKPTAALGKPPGTLGTPAIGRPMPVKHRLIDVVKKASLVAVKPTSGLRKPTPVTGKSADTLGNSTPVRNKPLPRLIMKIPATRGGKSRLIIGNSTALTGKPSALTGKPSPEAGKPTMEAGTSTLNTRKPKDMASSSTATLAVSQIASTSESSEDESGSFYHSKANESYNKMKEELTCPICLELYDKPIILPCSHSLCKQCLENLAQSRERNGQEGGVKCPSCRKVFKVSSKQVTLLPENLALKNTIFHFKQVSLHHQQIQNSRKKGETTNCCKDHSDEKVNMFCDQCKVLVCHLCLCEDQGQHIGHKVITKTSAASQIKEKLKLAQSNLEPLVNTVQERSKKIKELCEDIENVHNGACKQIEVQYNAVLKELQKKKELFVKTLTQEKTNAVSNLRRHEEQTNSRLTNVEGLIDSCQYILDESDIDEVLAKASELTSFSEDTHEIEDKLKKSESEFSELMRNCNVQEHLTEAVNKFRTALKDCVNPLSKEDKEREKDANMMPINEDIENEKGASNQDEDKEEDESRAEATFSYTIENISKLKDSILSPPCMVRNLPWKILAMPRYSHIFPERRYNQKTLGLYLLCNGESDSIIKRGPGLMPDPTPTKKRLSSINYSWLKPKLPKLSTPSEVQQQQNLHGIKRGPGLMPDPTPTKKRLSSINYSWLKPKLPKLSTPSEVQQQQNLHGSWSCKGKAAIQILTHNDADPIRKDFKHLFCSKENDCGYGNFVSWNDLMEPAKGFVKDDKVTIEVHVKADAPQGVRLIQGLVNPLNVIFTEAEGQGYWYEESHCHQMYNFDVSLNDKQDNK